VIAPVESWGLATRRRRDGCAKQRSFWLKKYFFIAGKPAPDFISRTNVVEETQYDNFSRDTKILMPASYNFSKRTFTT